MSYLFDSIGQSKSHRQTQDEWGGSVYSPMEGVGAGVYLLHNNAEEPSGLLCNEEEVRAPPPTQTSAKAVLF